MADSGRDGLSLFLRPWPKEESSPDSFKDLIKPIIDRYGHFRIATEDALSTEMKDQKKLEEEADDKEEKDDDDNYNDNDTDDDDGDESTQLETILKKKAKLKEMVDSSVQGSRMLLESISALESKFLPKQGEHTMSDFLKTNVGSGKFTYDTWELPKPNEHEEQKLRLVGKGWNHEVLSILADDLLKAATRLNNEVKKETKYWEQVLSVTENGWPVFKLPHEPGTLGVRFGATEAGPLFSTRGIAALRANDDGSIKLHRHITATPKAIRVRVSRDGVVTGNSHVGAAIESETAAFVSCARDSLFDQELYHEMALEARILGGYNVAFRDDAICISVDSTSGNDKYEIIVDLVHLDCNFEGASGTAADIRFANLVAVSLRLLLSHVFYQRLQQRSQPPPPLTERKPHTAPAIIIRPLLTYLMHRRATSQVYKLLNRTSKALQSAALPVDFGVAHGFVLDDLISRDKAQAAQDSTIQALMDVLIRPPQATATFTLPSFAFAPEGTKGDWVLEIKIRAVCAPPTFGVEYDMTVPTALKHAFFGLEKTVICSAAELAENFENMIAVDITHNIVVPRFNRWNARGWEPEIRRSVLTNKSRRRELRWIIEVKDGQLTAYRQWRGERFKTPQYKWDGEHHEVKFIDGLWKFIQSTKY